VYHDPTKIAAATAAALALASIDADIDVAIVSEMGERQGSGKST
jgi:hypothetical protein